MKNKVIYESPFIELITVSFGEVLTFSREFDYDEDENKGEWDSQDW